MAGHGVVDEKLKNTKNNSVQMFHNEFEIARSMDVDAGRRFWFTLWGDSFHNPHDCCY